MNTRIILENLLLPTSLDSFALTVMRLPSETLYVEGALLTAYDAASGDRLHTRITVPALTHIESQDGVVKELSRAIQVGARLLQQQTVGGLNA